MAAAARMPQERLEGTEGQGEVPEPATARPDEPAEADTEVSSVSRVPEIADFVLLPLPGDWHNRKLILAELTDRPELGAQRICVNDNKNFRWNPENPLEFKAEHLQADLWQLIGRCPRWPGRW